MLPWLEKYDTERQTPEKRKRDQRGGGKDVEKSVRLQTENDGKRKQICKLKCPNQDDEGQTPEEKEKKLNDGKKAEKIGTITIETLRLSLPRHRPWTS